MRSATRNDRGLRGLRLSRFSATENTRTSQIVVECDTRRSSGCSRRSIQTVRRRHVSEQRRRTARQVINYWFRFDHAPGDWLFTNRPSHRTIAKISARHSRDAAPVFVLAFALGRTLTAAAAAVASAASATIMAATCTATSAITRIAIVTAVIT